MTTVVLSPFDVVGFPEGGGHFWVYMQYALGLRRLGCEVYWLEEVRRRTDPDRDARALATVRERMGRVGVGRRVLLYTLAGGGSAPGGVLGGCRGEAAGVLGRAALGLDLHY